MKSGSSLPGTKEVNMLGRHGMTFMIRRFLTLAVMAGVVFFVVVFYETLEASYLDLIDSLMVDSPTTQSPVQGDLPTSIPLDSSPCDDEMGWIEEYISSGSMPRCSLAHQNKVNVLYT